MNLKDKELPALSVSSLQRTNSEFKTRETKVQGKPVTVYNANKIDEQIETQHILRSKADTGSSFTVDEFDDNGLYNRRTFWSCDIVHMKDSADKVTAIALYGPAKIIRLDAIHIAQLNVVPVHEKGHMEHGKELLKLCMEHIHELGYTGCLTDVLVTDNHTLGLYLEAGFIVMGTVPYTGITRQMGPTHSLLLYKQF